MARVDINDDLRMDVPEERESEAEESDEIHELALRRFKRASEAWAKQRIRERDDLKFQVPEMQWTEEAKLARQGGAAGTSLIPPRPMLSVSKIDQPISLVQNQERAAHLGVNIHPLTADADDDTAEVQQGLYRQIERDSQANLARSWGYDRASKVGFGCYRVNTVWDDDTEDPFDQKIVIERILDGTSAMFDMSATKPDFSDGEFAFVTEWLPRERFESEYPKAQIPDVDDLSFLDTNAYMPDWVSGDGEDLAVLVAEYWYKKHRKEPVKSPSGRKRQRDVTEVYFCKMTALEVLEGPQKWNGKYIPIIPVIGKELQPFNSERRWTGIIGPAKDGQRVFNYAISQAVESVALEPKAPFVGTAEQFEGHESEWQQINTRNFPYVRYTPHVFEGQLVAPPQRNPIDTSKMTLSMQLMNVAEGAVQSSTQYYNESLGNGNRRDRSGKAIAELQDQSEVANSHYLHNLADISMNYEARVVLDLMPKIYDRPGRVVRTLGIDDESKTVMLNKPFVQQGGGMPQPAPPGVEGSKHFDLSRGTYGVSISIGKSYQSRLQQGADEIGEILQARPELMPLIGPIYFKYRDFPGAQDLSDILKKVRDNQMPYLAKPDEGQEPTPEQMQAQVQSLTAQLQQAQGQLQQAGQAIETDQAKQQASMAKTQQDNATKVQLAQMQAQIDILIETLKQKGETERTNLKLAATETSDKFAAAHDVAMASHEQKHAIEQAVLPTVKPLDLTFAGKPGESLGKEDEL